VLAGEIGKPASDICRAGEDYALDFGSDRRQCRTDILAAIEQRGKPRRWHGLTRRRDERRKPPASGIAAGVPRAGEHNSAAGSRRCTQCRDCMGERMNDDDRVSAPAGDCFVAPLLAMTTLNSHCERSEVISMGQVPFYASPPK
jgi:hypothetical protein